MLCRMKTSSHQQLDQGIVKFIAPEALRGSVERWLFSLSNTNHSATGNIK